MKTKAEQIEELKATAAKLQQQIEALEKPKQWEPRGGGYWVSSWGDVLDGETTTTRTSEFGVERQTAEAAVKASDAMRTHNRLLAYVNEFGGDWEADWEKGKQEKCYVYVNSRWHELSQKWVWSRSFNNCIVGTVYMSLECAVGLRDKLNSGEVRL